MPLYIRALTIQHAIARLSASRGDACLLDYLVLKRTIEASGEQRVALGRRNETYIDAVKELAGTGWAEEDKKFFNPFDLNTESRGFRTEKYDSNGTSDTLAQQKYNRIVTVESRRPRLFSIVEADAGDLESALLRRKTKRNDKPYLSDMAIWYYRSTDVGDILGDIKNMPIERAKSMLCESFVSDTGLTKVELDALFLLP